MADPLKERISLLQEAEAQAIARGKTLKPEAQAELDRYRTQGIVKTAPNESSLARDNLRADAIAKIKLARSLRDRSKNQYFTTGAGSNIAGLFQGSPAYDVARDTETLKNAGALQRIMEMARDNGGKNPLTPLSNSDFQALASSLSNLDPGQSDEQYQKNLDVVENLYRRAYQSAGGGDLEAEISGKPADKNNGGASIGGAANPNGTPPNPPAGGPPDETGKYAGADIQMHMDSPENAQGYRFTPTQETALREYLTGGNATPEGYGRMMTAFAAAQGVNVDDAYTQNATANGAKLIEAAKAGKLADGMSYNQSDKDYRDRLLAEQDKKPLGDMATGQLLTSGATAGLNDEMSGVVGGAKSFLEGNGFEQGYRHDRDTVRAIRDRAYEKRPIISGATEMLGALVTPGGISNEVMRGGTLAERIAAGAKAGGRQGIAAGYGYGEGAGDSIKGAAIGGATGALIGGALPLAGKGLSAAYGRFAGKSDQAVADALPVIAAGKAENVPVSRAMIDPYIQNKVTATQATTLGGPVIDRGLKKTSDAIQTGVDALGRGGTPLSEPSIAGQVVRNAAERYIKTSGAVARRSYDKAERLAGDIKVPAQEMGQEIGSIISRLSETPGTNAGEINFLKTIESDLGKNLSIGALRRMRTQLRQRIAKGELSFGEDEARVLGIMDAAGRDITNGLTNAGKADAARAFQTADTAYRQRMDFINGTIQKLIGRRNDSVTPEATFARFKAMATPKGGEANLGRMINQMEPDEAADIAATLANQLGRNNKKNFTTAQLVTQVESLSPAARVHIFGKDGAESLSNLVTLAKSHDAIYSKLNHSRSGVATVGNLYRSAIATAFGVGATMGANTGTGLAATVATMGTLGARDVISARALMSTRLTRWAKAMPTTQEAIQNHIARLSTIAAREPAISGDVISLQNYLAAKFSESPSRAAATPGQDRNDRRPPPENNGQ